MKRNRSISDIFESLSINPQKKRKEYAIVRAVTQNDIFNIGKIKFEKDFYSKEEVITLINLRENTLYQKFKTFLYSYSDISPLSSIVTHWVK